MQSGKGKTKAVCPLARGLRCCRRTLSKTGAPIGDLAPRGLLFRLLGGGLQKFGRGMSDGAEGLQKPTRRLGSSGRSSSKVTVSRIPSVSRKIVGKIRHSVVEAVRVTLQTVVWISASWTPAH